MNKYINELVDFAIQELQTEGQFTQRMMVIKPDGKRAIIPPPFTKASLNIDCDSARINLKARLSVLLKGQEYNGFLLTHNKIMPNATDLHKEGGNNIYVLYKDENETCLHIQPYKMNDAGELSLEEPVILDNDPEEEQWKYAFIVEMLLSLPPDSFNSIPKHKWATYMPEEWQEYVLQQRENDNPDEWNRPEVKDDEAEVI